MTKKLKEKIHFLQQLWGTPETGNCVCRCTRNNNRRVSFKSKRYLFKIITKGIPKTCLQVC